MKKKKSNNKNTIFCFVCKEHIVVTGTDAKERLRRFHEFGHDNRKTDTMQRGLSGKPGERMG